MGAPTAGLTEAEFAARLAASSIAPGADSLSGAHRTANWLAEGLDRLPDVGEVPLAMDDPADLDIEAAGRRLRDGSLTALALVEAVLKRIAARQAQDLSFTRMLADEARAAARNADAELAAGIDRGPLHGIPVGIKDMIDVAGVATTAGSRTRGEMPATDDAALVARLRDAGAIIIGKLATYEWATVGPAFDTPFPPATNPWSPEHITGGSSSGSASAVAAGTLRIAIGTDTGGSIRAPANYCGLVGLKPSFGLVPMAGVLPLSPSLDHAGPLSATVSEAALTLDVLAALPAERSSARLIGQPIGGLSIGYARDWFAMDPQLHPAVLAALDEAASTLSSLGANVALVSLPDYSPAEIAAAAILHAESFAYHRQMLAARASDYGRKTYESLIAGAALTEAQLKRARAHGEAFRRELDDGVLAHHDVILTAGTLTPALPVELFRTGGVWTPMRTIGFNLSGHPALSLPAGFHEGLPIGLQLVGQHLGEAVLLQVGAAFEAATDFHLRRPPAAA
jgi:aspartyl-tRNA(Asn)/glutamyl-tRNA(Gln) amidotransferase subunit A